MKAILRKDLIENLANEITLPIVSLIYIGLCCLITFSRGDSNTYNYENIGMASIIVFGAMLPSIFLSTGLADARFGWIKFFLSSGGFRKDIFKAKLIYISLFILPIGILLLIPSAIAFFFLSSTTFPSWTLITSWLTGLFFSMGAGLLGVALPLVLSPNNTNLIYIINVSVICTLIGIGSFGIFNTALFSTMTIVPILCSVISLVLAIGYFIGMFFFAFNTFMKRDF